MDSVIAAVNCLAELQAGVVGLTQLRACGVSRGRLARRRAAGLWSDALPGVIRIAGAPVTWESEVVAAVLATGGRAVLSHTCAARLLGLDGFETATAVELSATGGFQGPADLLVHRVRTLERIDIHRLRRDVPPGRRSCAAVEPLGYLPVTTASRTIVDLAATIDAEALGRAIDSAARIGLSSPAYLSRRVADLRGRGRRGVRLLDEVMLDSGGHSWLERRFLRLVRLAGLPRPRCQVVHARGGRFVGRVDFDFDPHPVVVEVAGRKGHTSDADRARDARRRNELGSIGVHVLDFVTTQVIGDPDYVVRTVAAALRRHPPIAASPAPLPPVPRRRVHG